MIKLQLRRLLANLNRVLGTALFCTSTKKLKIDLSISVNLKPMWKKYFINQVDNVWLQIDTVFSLLHASAVQLVLRTDWVCLPNS